MWVMPTEDDEVLAREMLQIGRRALRFEEYVLRRAWGVYYAVWALFFSVLFIIPSVIGLVAPSLTDSPYPYFLGYGVAGGLAGWATYLNFEKVYRTIRLRRALLGGTQARRSLKIGGWILIGVSNFLLFLVPYYLLGFKGLSVGYLGLLYVGVWIYTALRRTFTDFPLEGVLAIASFASSCLLSIYSILEGDYLITETSWLLTMLVWVFCAFYALYHAPEMLVYDDE